MASSVNYIKWEVPQSWIPPLACSVCLLLFLNNVKWLPVLKSETFSVMDDLRANDPVLKHLSFFVSRFYPILRLIEHSRPTTCFGRGIRMVDQNWGRPRMVAPTRFILAYKTPLAQYLTTSTLSNILCCLISGGWRKQHRHV